METASLNHLQSSRRHSQGEDLERTLRELPAGKPFARQQPCGIGFYNRRGNWVGASKPAVPSK